MRKDPVSGELPSAQTLSWAVTVTSMDSSSRIQRVALLSGDAATDPTDTELMVRMTDSEPSTRASLIGTMLRVAEPALAAMVIGLAMVV